MAQNCMQGGCLSCGEGQWDGQEGAWGVMGRNMVTEPAGHCGPHTGLQLLQGCTAPSLNPSQQTCHPTDWAAALLVPIPLGSHFPLQIPLLSHSDNVALIAPGEESQTNSMAYLQHQQKNPTLRLSPIKRFTI